MPLDEALNRKFTRQTFLSHRDEARHYEQLHPEVYSKQEQKQISDTLKTVDTLVEGNKKKALDVGAGTEYWTGQTFRNGVQSHCY